jgi:hypothetical protein
MPAETWEIGVFWQSRGKNIISVEQKTEKVQDREITDTLG